jgi:hypothetical protein
MCLDEDIARIDCLIERLDEIASSLASVRIPVQRCHLIQAKAATHSTAKLPPIPVKVATL